MRKFLIVFFLLLLVISCSKKQEGRVLARIDDEVITVSDFEREIEKLPLNMKMLLTNEKAKREFLERLITRRILVREAKREKIEDTKEFEERLKDLREQLLIEALLRKRINVEANVTEDEMRAYYERNKQAFQKGGEINTRHILVKTQEEAREIQKRLIAGEDFVELAKKYSIDPNARVTGGELGFHPRGTLLPEYEEAAFKLKRVGEISGIVKTPLGYHIIRLEGVKGSSYIPFEEVKELIRQQIIQERQGEILGKYIEGLKKKTKVTINEEYLTETKGEAKGPEKK